jgi:3-methyladenine DNA glycosylase AlkD
VEIAALQRDLARRADPAKKAWWESYVKGAPFRGVPMPEVRAAVRDWLHPDLEPDEKKRLAYELIRQPLGEDKNAGILILSEHALGDLGPGDLADFRRLFEEHLTDWSSCDWFCVKVLGRTLASSPEAERVADELIEWTRSDDLWVRRAGLVGFVNLAPKGDAALPGLTDRVLAGAERNSRDPRRFAQTSVGWTLRELSKAEPEAVRAFLAEHGERLSAEARRAAAARLAD